MLKGHMSEVRGDDDEISKIIIITYLFVNVSSVSVSYTHLVSDVPITPIFIVLLPFILMGLISRCYHTVFNLSLIHI